MKEILLTIMMAFGLISTEAPAKQQVNLKGTNKVYRHKHVDLSEKYVIVLEDDVVEWKMKDLAVALRSEKEVHLVINSPGGSVSAGLIFINEIEGLRNQGKLESLQCYVVDMAASMAAMISAYCDGLMIHKFGFLMHHAASYGVRGSQQEIQRQVAFTEGYLAQIWNDIAVRYGITTKQLNEFILPERYMNARETVKYGFANAVFESLYHEGYKPEPPKRGGLFGIFGVIEADGR